MHQPQPKNFHRLSVVCLLVIGAVSAVSYAAGDSGDLRELRWLGFQNESEVSRVFVKTTEPVQYRVSQPSEDVVRLDLYNTRVSARNQTRALDTSQFDSPVLGVKAEELEGASRQVRIEIKTRSKAAFEVKQDDQQLAVEFKR